MPSPRHHDFPAPTCTRCGKRLMAYDLLQRLGTATTLTGPAEDSAELELAGVAVWCPHDDRQGRRRALGRKIQLRRSWA